MTQHRSRRLLVAVLAALALAVAACDPDGDGDSSTTTSSAPDSTTEATTSTTGGSTTTQSIPSGGETGWTDEDPGPNQTLEAVLVSGQDLAAGLGPPVVDLADRPTEPPVPLTYPGQFLVPESSADDVVGMLQDEPFDVVLAGRISEGTGVLVVVNSGPLSEADALQPGVLAGWAVGDVYSASGQITTGDVDPTTLLERVPALTAIFDPTGDPELGSPRGSPIVLDREPRPDQPASFTGLLGSGDLGPLMVEPNTSMSMEQSYRFRPGDDPADPGDGEAPVVEGDATGMSVLVLDTGMPDDTTPPLYGAVDFAYAGVETFVEGGDLAPEAGHGPFVADIVRQATGRTATVGLVRIPSQLRPLERLPTNAGVVPGRYREFSQGVLLQTLENLRVNDVGADVLNLSLGAYGTPDMEYRLLQTELDRLRSETGFEVIVAAAGNDDFDQPFYPAALENVIGVGSMIDDTDVKSCFSNFGPSVDVWGDGDMVVAAYPEWTPLNSSTAAWSGTSFATPVMAGHAAAGLAGGMDESRIMTEVSAASDPDDGVASTGEVDDTSTMTGCATSEEDEG